MTLPRFRLPEEDDDVDGDSTAPAQFVLKLPKSYARRLAPIPQVSTPSVPWVIETAFEEPRPKASPLQAMLAERAWLLALGIAALFGVVLIASVGVAATPAHGPVGIAHRAPKKIDSHIRVPERHAGAHAPAKAIVHAQPAARHVTRGSSSSHRRGT